MTHPHTMDHKLATGRGIVIGALISTATWLFIALTIGGLMTAGLSIADAQLARIDTVKQEHFVAQPRSIASARKDVRL